ncbi:MAG: cation transporter [Bauldia sp.]|nr:cation transporter [Bauldia sp.]
MLSPLRLALGSLVVGVVVFGLKYAAFLVTGSIGLYSDALESIINIGTALAALAAIWFAGKPADANHPYGHSKAEYFSAVAEGVLIIVAAATILREAYNGLIDPPEIVEVGQGLAINLAATALNAGWGILLITMGRRHRSPALAADGRHLMADVITSVGVVVGVLIATAFDVPVIDPIVAALVALNVLWSGWRLVRASIGGLMDEAPPPDELERVRALIASHAEGAIEAHDLRARLAGRLMFIDFHLVVPGGMSVSDAHDICDRIEQAIRDEVKDARITIHVEPENKAKHAGIVVL